MTSREENVNQYDLNIFIFLSSFLLSLDTLPFLLLR